MMTRLFIVAAALLLVASPAHADPISAIATVIMKVGVAAATATALAQVAFGLALNALVMALTKPKLKKPEISVRFETEIGDDTSLTFTVGQYVTAGKRKHIGSWGPNTAFITEVIEVSCLPQPGQPGLWINDHRAVIDWNATRSHTERVIVGYEEVDGIAPGTNGGRRRKAIYEETTVDIGRPVTSYGPWGQVCIKWIDGTQTEADPLLVAIFGNDPDYPWGEVLISTQK